MMLTRALERFLADTRLEGIVRIKRSDNGSELAGDVARVSHTNVGTLQRNGSVERSFSICDATQMASTEQAHVLFPDVDIPDIPCVLQSVQFRKISSPHLVYIGHPASLNLLPSLVPGYFKRRGTSKD